MIPVEFTDICSNNLNPHNPGSCRLHTINNNSLLRQDIKQQICYLNQLDMQLLQHHQKTLKDLHF